MPEMPRDNLFRSAPAFELRAHDDDGGMPTMVVNFARFNEWTEIDSLWEGRFLERMAPGAFRKTFREQRDQIRSIFQHGRDPVAGMKPLGTVEALREEDDGAWGEVQLFDADYVRELLPGIKAGVYGASFAFQVVREDIDNEPERSDDNPDGIPQRTVREVRLREFGPVTWGAYPNASTGARSLTDEFIAERDPQALRALADRIEAGGAKRQITVEIDGDAADVTAALESSTDDERTPDSESTSALVVPKRRALIRAREAWLASFDAGLATGRRA